MLLKSGGMMGWGCYSALHQSRTGPRARGSRADSIRTYCRCSLCIEAAPQHLGGRLTSHPSLHPSIHLSIQDRLVLVLVQLQHLLNNIVYSSIIIISTTIIISLTIRKGLRALLCSTHLYTTNTAYSLSARSPMCKQTE